MSQESPAGGDEGEATPRSPEELLEDAEMIAAIEESGELLEKMFSRTEADIPPGLSTAAGYLTDADVALETPGEGESGVALDPDIVRAIRRIDSELDEVEGVSRTPGEAAEAVAELYDGDRLAAMRDLLEEHHLRIVQQLLASDAGALSPREVAFRNEGIISESTVRDHLRKLTEKGFVEKLEPDVETVPNEMPRTFYAASPFAIELLQEVGLWENLGMLYQVYDSLDRPGDVSRIEEWEDRPVPEWL